MLKDVYQFIKSCKLCKENKIYKHTKIPMKLTTTSKQIFEKVAFDIVGPLPESESGNKYIITFQDDLTKYSGAIPIPNQEAQTVAKQIVTQVFTKFGFPDSLLTDQGSNFMSKLFVEMCKLLKIKKLSTTAFHPMSNGALERSHRTLKEYLRCFVGQDHSNWDEMVPFAIFVYNTTPHSITKFPPYELVFGKTPKIPSSIQGEPEPVYTYEDYLIELKSRFRLARYFARENIIDSKITSKNAYDKNTTPFNVNVGDFVWLKNDGARSKLDPLYLGPFQVTEINSPENTTININNKHKMVHNNRLKLH